MLSACSGAKRGASSIQTMPEGSVIASTSFGSGRRHALSGASRTMSAVVRTLGAERGARGRGGLRLGGDGRDEKARRRRRGEEGWRSMGTVFLGVKGQAARRSAIHASTCCSRMPKGTEPSASTASWNARRSKRAPRRSSARARSSRMRISPILYDSAWPGQLM